MDSSALSQDLQRQIGIQSALALVNPHSPSIAQLLYESATSNIHPLFARSRWLGLSHVQYISLAPALSLASRLLTCRKALHFFHALVYGHDSRDQFRRIFLDTSMPLPTMERAKVEALLTQLADIVTILFTKMTRCYHDAQTRPNGRIGKETPGSKSVIELPPSFLTDIDLANLTEEALLRRWAVSGITLAHECCHCLSNAVHGPEIEKRFENDEFKELGYAFEKFVVNGAISIDHMGTVNEVLHVKTIPVHELNALATNSQIRSELKPIVVDVIEGWKLYSMFSKSFWDNQ